MLATRHISEKLRQYDSASYPWRQLNWWRPRRTPSLTIIEKSFRVIWRIVEIKEGLPCTQSSLSLNENLRVKEDGKETTGICTLPMVPCGSSLVTGVSRSPLPREKRSTWGGGWRRVLDTLKELHNSSDDTKADTIPGLKTS